MSDTNNDAPLLVDASGAPVSSEPAAPEPMVVDPTTPHGPFLPEQWAHLKAWVRREMEMFEHGISRDQREVGNQ